MDKEYGESSCSKSALDGRMYIEAIYRRRHKGVDRVAAQLNVKVAFHRVVELQKSLCQMWPCTLIPTLLVDPSSQAEERFMKVDDNCN